MSVPDLNKIPGNIEGFKKEIEAVLSKYGITDYSYSFKFGRNYFVDSAPSLGQRKVSGPMKVIYPKRGG